LLQAVRRRIYYRHRSIWFERPLDDSLEIIKPQFDGRVDFDHSEAVIKWIAGRNIPGTNDAVEIESMRRRSQILAGVFDGRQMIGYVKIGWDKVYVLDYRIDLMLPKGAFFILDAYIMPEKRGLGGGPFIVSATSLEMKRRGFHRRLSHVRSDNTPMLKSGRRAGYREIGRVDFSILMGMKIFRPHPSSFLDEKTAR
jgi:GNAT superfamily N-acetyltransferase